MSWYTVTKTIKGRQYLYLQMTYREGGRVRTKNKYLGPASGGRRGSGSSSRASSPKYKHPKPDRIRRLKPKLYSSAPYDRKLLWAVKRQIASTRRIIRAEASVGKMPILKRFFTLKGLHARRKAKEFRDQREDRFFEAQELTEYAGAEKSASDEPI